MAFQYREKWRQINTTKKKKEVNILYIFYAWNATKEHDIRRNTRNLTQIQTIHETKHIYIWHVYA